MTISSQNRTAGPFTGSNTTTIFPFTFKVFQAADLKVVRRLVSTDVETTLVLGTDYSVTLNSNQDTSPGGNVVLTSVLATGRTLTITSELGYLQSTDLTNQGGFYPKVITNALDRLTIFAQQLFAGLNRSLKYPLSDTGIDATLPGKETLKGKVLAFSDSTGRPIAGPSIESVDSISAGIAAITTVANNMPRVITVADYIGDVVPVGQNIDDVIVVADQIAKVVSVADNMVDVQTVAANLTDVTNFADVYYGPNVTDPSTRKDGTALIQGDLYFNTTTDRMRVYTGDRWSEANSGSVTVQQFTGDGVETEFQLNISPDNENVVQVFIGGVYQSKTAYDLTGENDDILTFTSAPPNGAAIEAVTFSVLPLGVVDASQVQMPGGVSLDQLNLFNSTVRVGGFYAGELNHAGDIRRFLNRATNDHQQALIDALAYCRAENKAIYFPNGNWNFEEGTPPGGAVSVVGESVVGTTINLNFGVSAFLFDFNSAGGGFRSVGNFRVQGPSSYASNNNLVYMPNAYNTRFEKIYAINMGRLIDTVNSWGCHVEYIRGLYLANPIRMTLPNGATLEKIYIQRFTGTGIDLEAGLSTSLRGITMEYGEDGLGGAGGNGIVLRGMESWSLEEYYTEGTMNRDLLLTFKNQKACMNGRISRYWQNTAGNTKIIDCQSVRGLTVDDVTMITPELPLLDFSSRIYSDGLVDVGKVSQINPNANSFLGQQRNTGENLVPIATDNSLVRMVDYQPKIGNGTNADLQNVAPHTQVDAAGRLPFSAFPAGISAASTPSGLSATSSSTQNVFGTLSTGIVLTSRTHQRCQINVTGVATSSAGTAVFAAFRLNNETSGLNFDTSVREVGASGTETTQALFLNLVPGRNIVKLAITRAQGGIGTNTFTVSDFVVNQI